MAEDILSSTIGVNIQSNSVIKAGKSVCAVQKICEAFEMTTIQASKSDSHPASAFTLSVLEEMQVFISLQERKHSGTHKNKCESKYNTIAISVC